MSVVVLTNSNAARARARLPALRAALPESPALRHRLTRGAAEIEPLIAHDGWRPDDLLVLNGGDGTVQLALSALLAGCPSHCLPQVALLPGGTTNMSAYDINATRSYPRCVARLGAMLAHALEPAVPRSLVAVDDGSTRHCGLFFGVGTIVRGIEYFHERIRPHGAAHEWAAGVALARTVWGMARRQPPFAEPLMLRLGDAAPLAVRIAFVTTLDRLFLGMRPYWGDGRGALKGTLVEARAPRFAASLPRLLRGRPSPLMCDANGYRSGRLCRTELQFHGSYTLDGELFPSRGDTMRISATVPIGFLSL